MTLTGRMHRQELHNSLTAVAAVLAVLAAVAWLLSRINR